MVAAPELVEVGDPASPDEEALVEALSIKPCPKCGAMPHISIVEVIRSAGAGTSLPGWRGEGDPA
jgi:formate dehydrogenase maturation protein FdhE